MKLEQYDIIMNYWTYLWKHFNYNLDATCEDQ